jgi:riboflavin biosynthesis pyrimidine reductase
VGLHRAAAHEQARADLRPTTVRWLLRAGLLDELNLLVHPLAVGGGLAPLFPPDEPPIPLELLRSEAFQTGVLNLSYGPAAPA